MVISSVYSMSLPTGMPMAMRVTFTPARLSCWERYVAVASPSTVGLVARMTSSTLPASTRVIEVRDAELFGADAVQRGDRAVQDVEDSVEVLGLFDGGDVGGLLDHADQALVASGAGAVDARIDICDVVADRAEAEVGLDVTHGGGEGFGVFIA